MDNLLVHISVMAKYHSGYSDAVRGAASDNKLIPDELGIVTAKKQQISTWQLAPKQKP